MELSNELKKIKKTYGENFMKLCRNLFPTLLEQEGRLYEILATSFSTNCKTLYEDIPSRIANVTRDWKKIFRYYTRK